MANVGSERTAAPSGGGRLRALVTSTWHHLFRAAARRAWALIGVCFVVYLLLDRYSTLPQLQEFVLIVAGVAGGAIFLPELSASLWDLDPARIRGLVPERKIKGLHRAVVDASLGTDREATRWADLVWHQTIEPLLAADRDRRQLQWDLRYDITVHPGKELVVAAADLAAGPDEPASAADPGTAASALAVPVTFVATRLRARRVVTLAPDGRFWVAAARTESALANEFAIPHCVLRELVDLPEVEAIGWRMVVERSCRVSVHVNGVQVPLEIADGEPIPDIVRWEGSLDRETVADYATIEISFDFPVDPATTRFPMLFPRFYSAGTTRLSFTLDSSDPLLELRMQPFLASTPGRTFAAPSVERTPVVQRFVLESPPETLLWPGSGAQFEWGRPAAGAPAEVSR